MVDPQRLRSFVATVEGAIKPLGLMLEYAPDKQDPVHMFRVSRDQGTRHVSYVFAESSITDTEAQELITAIKRDFPPIMYVI
jgi:hypothetical protein